MIRFLQVLFGSTKAFFTCKEIPLRNRLVVALILLSIVSPLDIIPDTIPVIGLVDDLFWLATLYDYAFRVLDRELALKLYKGSPASFRRWETSLAWLNWLRPATLVRPIWKRLP